MNFKILIVFALIFSNNLVKAGYVVKNVGSTLHCISIGVNDYPAPRYSLNNCVNDGNAFVNKLRQHNNRTAIDSFEGRRSFKFDTVAAYELYNEEATLENIIQTFKTVALSAHPNDEFIFYFGGLTFENSATSSYIYPYMKKGIDVKNVNLDSVLTVAELAKLMNQINCRNQLIISESGYGENFASNLLFDLFETNPLHINSRQHNRIIITTKQFGYDSHKCDGVQIEHGPLMYYILQCSNPINVFSNRSHNYELELYAAQEKCPSSAANQYFKVYYENDYAPFIRRIIAKPVKSRGGVTKKVQTDYVNKAPDEAPKTYGLFIATDQYNPKSNWQSLANPINDAKSISAILEDKYGVSVVTFYNTNIDDVWKGMDELFDKIREQDKLVVFIAGHGYYESKTGTAALPMTDSKSPSEDFRLTTYLEFSYLRQRLDNLPTKNVFAIFDVCFGANFDANAHDLPIAQYESTLQDIDIDQFDARMNEEKTRIFIASGKYEVPDYWNNSLDHSPFAAKLIHGLKKEKQFVTPTKLYGYATANATKPELKYFGQHHTHSDFVLKVR